jgi:PKD repeat protein
MKTIMNRQQVIMASLIAITAGSTSFALADDKKNEGWRIEQRQKWAADIRGLNTETNARSMREGAVRQLRLRTAERSMIATAAGETWVEMGPSAMNMSGWSFGKVSGRNNAITPHPTDENTVYFGAAAGGVWKTTNGGTSWTPVFDQVGTLPIGAITIDPNNTERVWVGTGDKNQGCLGAYLGQGVSLSTDGGLSWTNMNGSGNTNMPLSIVNSVALSSTNSNQVLAGGFGACDASGQLANGGVYRTVNGGSSWTKVLSGKVEDIVFAPGTNTAYASVQGTGVYKTTDGGATWTNASTGISAATGRVRIAMAPSNPAILYALNGSKLFKTTNSGASWTSVNTAACEGQCTYNQALSVNATDPNKILIGSIRFALSTNGGTSLSYLTASWGTGQKVHQDTHVLVWSKTNPNRFWVGSDGGIWRSDDGGTNYINMNANLNVTQFYDIAVDFSNGDKMFGGAQDNSSSGRTTSTVWGLTYASGDGFMNAIDPSNPNVVLQTSYPNGGFPSIVRSTTGGGANSFTSLSTSGITSSNNFPWVTPLATAGTKVWTASDAVYVGTTSASSFSWSKLTGALGGAASVITPKQSGSSYVVYVGTAAGKVFYSNNAGTAGAALTDVTGNIATGRISDIAIDPNNNLRVFATRSNFTGTHLYRSTSGGNTWSAVGNGLPAVPAHTVAIDPLNTQRIFVGTDIGAYESADGGDNFVPFNTGLPLGVIVQDLEISSSPHTMVAATYARGAWKVNLSGSNNIPPVAGFSSSVNLLTVAFTNSSTDADGSITSYQWNFGDTTTSTLQNPSKTYTAAGTYNVSLTVTDDRGATNTTTKAVTVAAANQAPVANFSSSVAGLTVNFTDSSTDADGTIASRSWNFGDSTSSTAQNPSKTYSAAGTYSVALSVTDNGGASNTTTKSVTVTAGACSGTTIQGSFTGAAGQSQIQPGGSYYQSTVSGTHKVCLTGPAGTDFDIYLDKWVNSTWTQVALSEGSTSTEAINYNGTEGYYRYRVVNYSGVGAYTMIYSKP